MTQNNILDLTRVKCPLNFVKAKLALEKRISGESLEVWLDATGENVLSVANSLKQEGHQVEILQAEPVLKLNVIKQ